MKELNFPKYQFKIKTEGQRTQIFDVVRKKFVYLTPEEWVRQHAIHFLHLERQYPLTLMRVERQLKLNDLTKRFDLVCYNTNGEPVLLAEFKQPDIAITQGAFNQIARYNFVLKTPLLWVSNGISQYVAEIDLTDKEVRFIKDIPPFKQ